MTDYLVLLMIFTFFVCSTTAFIIYSAGKSVYTKITKKPKDEKLSKIMHWVHIAFFFSWSVFLIIATPYLGVWNVTI